MNPEKREEWDLLLNSLPPRAVSELAADVAEAEGSGFMALLAGGGPGIRAGG
jgi:hypothetical protein